MKWVIPVLSLHRASFRSNALLKGASVTDDLQLYHIWGFSLLPLTELASPHWTERCDQLWARTDTTRRRCCISSVCSEQKPAEPTELHHHRFCSAAVKKSTPLMSCCGFIVCDADRWIGVNSRRRPAAWRASLEPDVRLCLINLKTKTGESSFVLIIQFHTSACIKLTAHVSFRKYSEVVLE